MDQFVADLSVRDLFVPDLFVPVDAGSVDGGSDQFLAPDLFVAMDAGVDLGRPDLHIAVDHGPDLSRPDLGDEPWVPSCVVGGETLDLTGLRLPDGVDGLAVFQLYRIFNWDRADPIRPVLYVAGDYCEPDGSCRWPGQTHADLPYGISVRVSDTYEWRTLDEVLPGRIERPQEAILAALAAQIGVPCDPEPWQGVGDVGSGFTVVGGSLICSDEAQREHERYMKTVFVNYSGATTILLQEPWMGSVCTEIAGRLTGPALPPTQSRRCADSLGDHFARNAALEARAVDATPRISYSRKMFRFMVARC